MRIMDDNSTPLSLSQTVIHISQNKSITIPTKHLKTIIKFGIKDLLVPLNLKDFKHLIYPPDDIDFLVNRICYRTTIPFEAEPTKVYEPFIPPNHVRVEEHGIQEYMVALIESSNNYFRSYLPKYSRPDLELYLHTLISTILESSSNLGISLLVSAFSNKYKEETEAASKWVKEFLDQPTTEDYHISAAINKVFEMNAPEGARSYFIDSYKLICKDAFRFLKNSPELRFSMNYEVTTLPEILKLTLFYNSFEHDNSVLNDNFWNSEFFIIAIPDDILKSKSPAQIFTDTFSTAMNHCHNRSKYKSNWENSFEGARVAMSIILQCPTFFPHKTKFTNLINLLDNYRSSGKGSLDILYRNISDIAFILPNSVQTKNSQGSQVNHIDNHDPPHCSNCKHWHYGTKHTRCPFAKSKPKNSGPSNGDNRRPPRRHNRYNNNKRKFNDA